MLGLTYLPKEAPSEAGIYLCLFSCFRCGFPRLLRSLQLFTASIWFFTFNQLSNTHYIWFGKNITIRHLYKHTTHHDNRTTKEFEKCKYNRQSRESHKPEGRTFTRKLQFHAFWAPEEKKEKKSKLKITPYKFSLSSLYQTIITQWQHQHKQPEDCFLLTTQ